MPQGIQLMASLYSSNSSGCHTGRGTSASGSSWSPWQTSQADCSHSMDSQPAGCTWRDWWVSGTCPTLHVVDRPTAWGSCQPSGIHRGGRVDSLPVCLCISSLSSSFTLSFYVIVSSLRPLTLQETHVQEHNYILSLLRISFLLFWEVCTSNLPVASSVATMTNDNMVSF